MTARWSELPRPQKNLSIQPPHKPRKEPFAHWSTGTRPSHSSSLADDRTTLEDIDEDETNEAPGVSGEGQIWLKRGMKLQQVLPVCVAATGCSWEHRSAGKWLLGCISYKFVFGNALGKSFMYGGAKGPTS
ncbi:hypothetical protein TNIN_231681 [Trichonephila inaurata madagascariensis]|uniref:Uncharacterized protein n=1 Tax=Trichonephila inaurata madagascariensis TaxID=2747483 RepID=A0A8X7BY48_9ARAC|nr:hypothetical protein TNIN_231681 [Trichonephila inaurata madagascariensis]